MPAPAVINKIVRAGGPSFLTQLMIEDLSGKNLCFLIFTRIIIFNWKRRLVHSFLLRERKSSSPLDILYPPTACMYTREYKAQSINFTTIHTHIHTHTNTHTLTHQHCYVNYVTHTLCRTLHKNLHCRLRALYLTSLQWLPVVRGAEGQIDT